MKAIQGSLVRSALSIGFTFVAFSIYRAGGDDTGFSEMTDAQRARAIALFNWRKRHLTKLKWFEELPEYKE